MTKTLPITEVRNNLTTLVDRVNKLMDEYIITVNGKPAAVLMSAQEYESWRETNEILSDPKLVKSIKEGEEDIKNGRFITLEDFRKELKLDV